MRAARSGAAWSPRTAGRCSAWACVCGYLGAAPSLLWAVSALALVFAPLLILASIWLYTLVFAFSALWFTHFLLAALRDLRARRECAAPSWRPRRIESGPPPLQAVDADSRRDDAMNFGLIIIGDEILSGKRADKHLPKVIELLGARGLALSWARYVGDEPARITADLRDAFASGDVVFLVRRHRRHAGRPHAPVRGGRARRSARCSIPRRATSSSSACATSHASRRPASIRTATTTGIASTWPSFPRAPTSFPTRTTRSPAFRCGAAPAACSSFRAFR